QEREAPANLLQNFFRDRLFLLRQLEIAEESLRLAHGQRRDLIDRAARDLDVTCLAAQPRAAAVGARQIATVPAQEHADVHFVFLPFEPPEEPANAVVVLAALDDEAFLLVRELGPRRVEANLGFLGRALQPGELRAIVRFAPRLDGALIDGLARIGHDER